MTSPASAPAGPAPARAEAAPPRPGEPAGVPDGRAADATRWALLFGNFVIGCGVMSVAGAINDITRSLQVSVALAGQLITIAAAVMGFGAPLLAGWVAGFDRRRLLAWAMVWFAVGHALCALMPSYAALWPVRALTMLAAAVFTPQAAAAMGVMAPAARRGRAVTFIFIGWSVASVIGLPLAAWISETFGWQATFAAIAGLALAAAAWVFATMPDGVRPGAVSLAAWGRLFRHPVLMSMVLVTALLGAGQFTLFSYLAPYYKDVLGAGPEQITLLFAWFGVFGLVGNLLVVRHIDRIGPSRAVFGAASGMLATLLLWPLAGGFGAMAVVLVPWALGCFSANSGQQARLTIAAPALAPALMALNTSAIYLGQAVGAAGGGWLVAHHGYGGLSWVGAAWIAGALALSGWVARRATGLAP